MKALPETAIVAESLRKSFRGFTAVDNVTLSVPTGSVCGVIGANGAGKTTTVRMLATLTRPDSGSARIFGMDLVRHAAAIRRLTSLTGQYASLDEDLDALANLELFARLRGLHPRAARRRARDLIDLFGLSAAAGRQVSEFSGGMRRRIDLAASLITTPALLFLDEPTTGLDPTSRAQMWDMVTDLVAAGSTVLLTTQYLEEADRLSDSLVFINRGRVVAQGSVDVLKERIGNKTLQLAISDPAHLREAETILRANLGPGAAVHRNDRRLAATVTDPAVSGRVLADLAVAGIGVAELAVTRPSLDDVFFELTGRQTA